ncbi:hypothetical protein BDV97DRAFT_185067 [Delphinella strobiligena]|nr:hypothetical protein BDV97DRAFT_185067 [Delphinella strobiligena]
MYAYAALALAGAAMAIPNPVPSLTQSTVKPSGSAPAGCSSSYSGTFEISIVNASTASTKRSIQKRTALELTLENGVLLDAQSRVGYIASNYQFQFDNPVQAGYIYDCLSGTFYNLYDESTGAQCSEIYIDIVPVSASAAVTTSVSQVSDGQIQATTGTAAVVSQISDGQIQATTATHAVVSQISDGQIQATTGTAAVVSQISDGQIQATTAKPAVVSQISDGQIQATSAGTISAAHGTNGTAVAAVSATATQSYTGAASFPTMKAELFGLAAGVLAMAML